MSARSALERSINIPTVRVSLMAGLPFVLGAAREAGIGSRLRGYPSVALGAFEISPMEIAGAYPPGEPENKASLAAAAKQYGAIFDKHHGDLAGLYARLGQARCWKQSGQTNEAMAVFV